MDLKDEPKSRRKKRELKPVARTVRDVNGKHRTIYRVRLGSKITGGAMIERSFAREAEAKAFISREMIRYRNHGTETANTLGSEKDRAMLVQCLNRLAQLPHKVTLNEVIDFYIARMAPEGEKELTVAAYEFLTDPEQSWSRVYKVNVRSEVNGFAAKYARSKVRAEGAKATMVHEVSAEMIRDWLKTSPEPKTHNNRRGQISSFFSWCVKKKYCALNPVSEVTTKKLVRKLPGILTVEQVRELLHGAQKYMPDLIPSLVLGLFGCVRRAEAIRLQWNQIVHGAIRLDGEQAKTRSYRIIPLSKNLTSWLELCRMPEGPVVPFSDLDRWPISDQIDATKYTTQELKEQHCNLVEGHRRRDLISKLGWKSWPDNCLRHSCASYSIVRPGIDENLLALALGHSVAVLHAKYKNLVTAQQAEDYFNILPK